MHIGIYETKTNNFLFVQLFLGAGPYRTVKFNLIAHTKGCKSVQITFRTQSYGVLGGTSLTDPFFISINVSQEKQMDIFAMHHFLEGTFYLFCCYIYHRTLTAISCCVLIKQLILNILFHHQRLIIGVVNTRYNPIIE